jgi:hypothetical protein
MGSKSTNSLRNLFKKLEMLPLKSQYTFSLILLVANKRDVLQTESENQSTET